MLNPKQYQNEVERVRNFVYYNKKYRTKKGILDLMSEGIVQSACILQMNEYDKDLPNFKNQINSIKDRIMFYTNVSRVLVGLEPFKDREYVNKFLKDIGYKAEI